MELKKQLKQDGIAKGLCSQYQGLIDRSQSIEALVRLFIRGIDFCIKHDYPTLEFMRENFKGKSEPYGGYVDDEITTFGLNSLAILGAASHSFNTN